MPEPPEPRVLIACPLCIHMHWPADQRDQYARHWRLWHEPPRTLREAEREQ